MMETFCFTAAILSMHIPHHRIRTSHKKKNLLLVMQMEAAEYSYKIVEVQDAGEDSGDG